MLALLEPQHLAAAALAGREAEVDRRGAAVGRRDALELLEVFDAALHQRRLRGLVAEAADERLDAGDLFLLGLVGGGRLRAALLARLEVAAVRRLRSR